MRNISNKSYVEDQNTPFMPNNLFSEYHALHEIMWKNITEPCK